MVLVCVTAIAQKLDIAFGSFDTQQVLLLPYDLLQQTGVVLPKNT